MDNWTSKWKVSKTAFVTKVGQKKPSAETLEAIKKGNGYSEFEQALKHCDPYFKFSDPGAGDLAKKPDAAKKFGAAIKVLEAKVKACEKELHEAVAKADAKLVQPEILILMKHIHQLTADMKAKLAKGNEGAKGGHAS